MRAGRRWRLAAAAALAAVALLLLAVAGAGGRARSRLAEHTRTLERLVADAAAVTRAAEELLAARGYDLAAVVATPLVGDILNEFVGYEQLTRRGNRFRIETLESEFRDGHVVLRARADFDWRLGLYHGPIEVTYLAFARLSPEGECWLYFRVAELRTLAPWTLLNRWLEPILTVRMQRRLEIPDFRLPLGSSDADGGLAVERRLGAAVAGEGPSGRVRVSVPRPAWDLRGRRALAFVNPLELGLVVERPEGPPADPAPAVVAAEPSALRLAVRLDFLADQLARGLGADADLTLEIQSLERVWQRPGRLLGVEFDNHVDLERLTGSVDVQGLELRPQQGGLTARVALAAQVSGILAGEIYGVAAALPFRAVSRAEEDVPLRVLGTSAGLRLATDLETLTVPVDLEAEVLGQAIRFRYPLEIPWSDLLAAVEVPDMLASAVAIPVVVERRAVRTRRTLPIRVDWRIELPARADGLLEAWGEVTLEPAGGGPR